MKYDSGLCKRFGNDAEDVRVPATILHMFDILIPRDMDGRVLKEIFKPDSELAGREVEYQKISEKDIIKERIKDLKKLGSV